MSLLGTLKDLLIEHVGSDDLSMRTRQSGSEIFGHEAYDVAVAGTSEQLTAQACREITITAKDDNNGKIYVGDSTVSNTDFGTFLRSSDSVTILVGNCDMIYIDADNGGEGIRYYYV